MWKHVVACAVTTRAFSCACALCVLQLLDVTVERCGRKALYAQSGLIQLNGGCRVEGEREVDTQGSIEDI